MGRAFEAQKTRSVKVPNNIGEKSNGKGLIQFYEAKRFSEYLLNREKIIAERAEWHWRKRGCPEGSPEVDWLRAESEFDQELLSQIELGIPS